MLSVIFLQLGLTQPGAFCISGGSGGTGRATLDRLSRPLEALLGAFEPEGVAAAESLSKRLEASRG